jgi:muramidase (phage lysozyme)
MESALQYGKEKAEFEDRVMASLGALHLMQEELQLMPSNELQQKSKKKPFSDRILEHILHWAERKILKRIRKEIFSLIWRTLRRGVVWIFERTILPVFEFATKRLIVPILETILEVVAGPEVLIAAGIGAVAVGLGFLGKWLFDKYFMSGKPPDGSKGLGHIPLVGAAEAPIPAGEAVVPTARVAPPPMPTTRQGLAVKTFGRLETLLQRGESGKAGYDAYNFSSIGKVHKYAGTPLTQMTIAEVQQQQQSHNYNAVGRYQLIKDTLSEAVKALNLDTSQKFDAEMQDRIFENYLLPTKRRTIADYIQGRSDDVWAAVFAAAQEWASVAAPPGYPLKKGGLGDGLKSYYAGVQGNAASISATEMAQTLEQERLNYLGQATKTTIQTGVSVPGQQVTTQNQIKQTPAQVSTVTGLPSTKSILKHRGVLLAVNG